MCQYASLRSILQSQAPSGRTRQTSRTVVILNVGQVMDLLRVDKSRMTLLLVEPFLGTENNGPWKAKDDVFSMALAAKRSLV